VYKPYRNCFRLKSSKSAIMSCKNHKKQYLYEYINSMLPQVYYNSGIFQWKCHHLCALSKLWNVYLVNPCFPQRACNMLSRVVERALGRWWYWTQRWKHLQAPHLVTSLSSMLKTHRVLSVLVGSPPSFPTATS
jgi:hypothetical protein